MDLGKWALGNRPLVLFLLVVLTLGGFWAYRDMSKLEDPEIRVKQAAVVTLYPGASAHEVELEVTDLLEKSIRKLSVVKKVTSSSSADMSFITVEMSELLGNDEVEGAFEQLRRKVSDVQGQLPKGARPSMVRDDLGDVYGMFYALTYRGYTNERAAEYAELVRRSVQTIKGVSQVSIFGVWAKTINVDLKEDKLASLGILPAQILSLIQGQNNAIYSGYYDAGGQRLRVYVNDRYRTVEDIASLTLQSLEGKQMRLGDIADLSEAYAHPQRQAMRYDGTEAIGVAISARSGTDITQIGKEVTAMLERLEAERLPAGIEMHKVFYQPERVEAALGDFMLNLVESVILVVLVLLFFMGWRSGFILATGLLVIVMGSLLILQMMDGTLQRVSLVAFVLAMGMLVDNAIVVLDGVQVNLEGGMERERALTEPGRKTAMPLLGATLISVLSFLPLYLSPDTSGIYVRDLFIVLAVSLLLSWVLALVMNPLMADWLFHFKAKTEASADPYSGRGYQRLERLVAWILEHRFLSMGLSVGLILLSLWGFRFIPQGFFPDMDYDQLYIEYKLPESYTTERVDKDIRQIEAYLKGRSEVTHITASIGGTPARYNLVRSVTPTSLSYGELIVNFSSPNEALNNLDEIQSYLTEHFPEAQVRVKRYNLMFKEYPIEYVISGPDPAVLRHLADSAVRLIQEEPQLLMARSNWFPRVPSVEVQYDQTKALRSGLSRKDIGLSLLSATYGLPMGTFYDGDKAKTITIRTVGQDGKPTEGIENASIFSTLPSLTMLGQGTLQGIATGAITKADIISALTTPKPLGGVSDGLKLRWEEPVIQRSQGQRTIKVQAMPRSGISTESLRKTIAPKLEGIPLPVGYSAEWEGEKGASADAMGYIFSTYPLAIVLMIAILIMLFGDYKKPLVALACLPIIFVGVTWGMLLMGKTFTFTAIVALLGLVGMMIKSVIVLLDEVNLLTGQGMGDYEALLLSAKSRVRPVMLAAATTILGMIPLLGDALFGPAAVTIMSGLIVASVATILFVPLVYAFVYRVHKPKS